MPATSHHQLSHSQKQIWVGQGLHPQSPLYNMALAFTIDGELDVELFERAFAHVVATTDALRSIFDHGDTTVTRTVLPSLEPDLQVIDCGEGADGTAKARQFIDTSARTPLDVSKKCFESALLRCGHDRHVWFLNQHHLIADAWSFTIIYQRLINAYDALEQGRTPSVDDAPDYQALLDHETERVDAPDRLAAIDYWDNLSVPRSKLYGRSGGNTTTSSTRLRRGFGQARTAQLNRLVEQQGIRTFTRDLTVFSVLAAVVSAWISRTSGQSQISLGFLGHNRAARDFKQIAGNFVELFPLVNELDADDTFASLIARTSAQSMQSLRRVGNSVSQPRFTRDLNVVFNLINASFPAFGSRQVTTEWVDNGHGDAVRDLRVHFHDFDGTGELTAVFDFKDAAFDPQQSEFAIDHFFQLLDACLDSAEHRVADVQLVGTREQNLLREVAASSPQPAANTDQPAIRRFEQSVERYPDRIACWANGETLTYRQLDQAANALAHRLCALERSSDDVLAVCVGRSLDFAVAIIAAHKAGAAYLPINAEDPLERRSALIAQSAAFAVIIDDATTDADRLGAQTLCVDLEAAEPVGPDIDITGSQLAYVIGTSGSTGVPKLIQVEHRNLSSLLGGLRERIYDSLVTPEESLNIAVVAPFGFDSSIKQLFASLAFGQTLYIVPHQVRVDGRSLYNFLQQHRITVSDGTPAHLRMLLDAASDDLEELAVHFLIGGDVLPKPLARRFLENVTPGSVTLWNLYGPAECAVDTTLWPVTLDGLDNHQTVPIGTPLPGVRVAAVDDQGRHQPFGVIGELYIAGTGVGRGYLGDADLTAQTFLDDPQHHGDRLYRSGDLGRISSAGVVEFAERNDLMAKVQGYRIELSEIENALQRQVADAAVKVIEDRNGARQLHAFYVADQAKTVDELRFALDQTLPHYMIPARFFRVDEIPITPNGKVDRDALQATSHRPELATEFAAPTNEVEAQLASIWADVLGMDQVGIRDGFFSIGGDSIMVLEVVSRANNAGLPVTPMQIFSTPTILGIAALIEAAESTKDVLDRVDRTAPSARLDPTQPPPMTLAEQSLLLDQNLRPDDHMFNTAALYKVTGSVDAKRFDEAVRLVAQQHEPLHWTFASNRKRLTSDQAVLCRVEPTRQAGPEVDEIVAQMQTQPWDLHDGPLVRVLIQPLESGDTLIALNLHHISVDHGSFDIFWQAVASVYSGAGALVPEIGVADLEAWQAKNWDRDQAFWSTQPFGAVFSSPPQGDQDDGYIELASMLPGSELRAAGGRSMFAVAVASAAAAVRPLYLTDEVEVCLVASTRNHELARPLVGYLLNPLPLQFSAASERTFDSLADDVSQATAEALVHRSYPFARMVQDARQQGRTAPAGQVFVAISDEPTLELDGACVEQRVRFNGNAVTDLTLFVQLRGESLTVAVEYGRAVGRAAARMTLALFEQSLMALVRTPHITMGDLEVRTERPSVLVGAPLDDHRLVCDAVLGNIASGNVDTSGIAVEVGGSELSWADLVGRASFVSQSLRAQGVGAGDRVLVRAERSVHVPVALLGVLLSGASYVPISVTLPAERVAEHAEAVGATIEISTPTVPGVVDSTLVIDDDTFDGVAWVAPSDLPSDLPGANDEAYVIFTSGSTGRPNPVAITHGQIAASTNARSQVYTDSPTRFGVLSGLGFDSSLVGLIWVLCTGGTVILPTDDESQDVDALASLLATSSLSHALCVPTLYGLLLHRRPSSGWPQHVIVAGEACTEGLVANHFRLVPASQLTNEYGPTEASIWATAHQCQPNQGPPPIGAPIPGAMVAVTDHAGRVLPVGVPGELVLSGPTVAAGYVTDPNHHRFGAVSDLRGVPATTCADDRIFRTGDRAVIYDDAVHFLGRTDEQLNLSGVRVEPGELEAVLASMEGVDAAAVVAVDVRTIDEMIAQTPADDLALALTQAATDADPAARLRAELSPFGETDLRLVAHLAGSADLDLGALRQHVGARVDPLRQPRIFAIHDDLPRTTNGKVDRKAAARLPLPDTREPAAPSADATAWEQHVTDLFRDVLRTSHIDPNESFFDLGGDSLQALKLLNLLEERHGVLLPAAAVHKAPTVHMLAARIETTTLGATVSTAAAGTLDDLVADDELIAIELQTGGDQVPIFALHVIGPGGDMWHPLVNAIGDEYPFYCLSDVRAIMNPWQEAEIIETRSLEAAATRYANAIRNVVPDGPVNLVGLCQGGLLAFETAHQLQPMGAEIDSVVIIHDAHAPRGDAFPGFWATLKAAKHARNQSWVHYLTGMLRRGLYTRHLAYHGGAAALRVAKKLKIPTAGPLRRIERIEESIADLEEYQYRHFDGRLRIVRGEGAISGALSGDWSGSASDLDVRLVPGNGEALLEPEYVAGTAQALQDWLHRDSSDGVSAIGLVAAIHNRSIDYHLPRLIDQAASPSEREKLQRIDAVAKAMADGLQAEARHLLATASAGEASAQLAPIPHRAVVPVAAMVAKPQGFDSLQNTFASNGYELRQFAAGHNDVFVHPHKPWRFTVAKTDESDLERSNNTANDVSTVNGVGQLGGLLGTPRGLIPPLLSFGGAQTDDLIVDLGCGDARVLIAAAEQFGMRGRGIESDPAVFELAVDNVRRAGLADRIEIVQGDATDADIDQADLVFAFVPPDGARALITTAVPRLSASARLVVHEVLAVDYPIAPTDIEVLVSEPNAGPNDIGLTVAARWTSSAANDADVQG